MKTKGNHIKDIINIIESKNIFFIEDIFCYYTDIKRTQFYNLKLNESDTLLKAMTKNKIQTLHGMRAKWYRSDNCTLQIALYKLLCEDDQRRKLAINYNEVTGKDGEPLTVQIYKMPDGTEIKF